MRKFDWLIWNFGLATACSIGLVLGVWVRYGSAQTFVAEWKGKVVSIESPVVTLNDLGVNEAKEFSVLLRNVSREPVNLLNTRTSCSCTSAENQFPITVASHGYVVLKYSLHAPSTAGSFLETIQVTTSSSPSIVSCVVRGLVREKTAPE